MFDGCRWTCQGYNREASEREVVHRGSPTGRLEKLEDPTGRMARLWLNRLKHSARRSREGGLCHGHRSLHHLNSSGWHEVVSRRHTTFVAREILSGVFFFLSVYLMEVIHIVHGQSGRRCYKRYIPGVLVSCCIYGVSVMAWRSRGLLVNIQANRYMAEYGR